LRSNNGFEWRSNDANGGARRCLNGGKRISERNMETKEDGMRGSRSAL